MQSQNTKKAQSHRVKLKSHIVLLRRTFIMQYDRSEVKYIAGIIYESEKFRVLRTGPLPLEKLS